LIPFKILPTKTYIHTFSSTSATVGNISGRHLLGSPADSLMLEMIVFSPFKWLAFHHFFEFGEQPEVTW
jgi:hypothetical protein